MRLVAGSTRVRLLPSVLVTHTAPSPNAMPHEPAGTWISATGVLVAGSKRTSVPFLSMTSQTLDAPTAMPPSLVPMVVAIVAVTLLVFRSTRAKVLSRQLGTQRLPNPTASPEQGRLPVVIVATTVLVFGSSRLTVSFGALDTQACSSIASQSGEPGTS